MSDDIDRKLEKAIERESYNSRKEAFAKLGYDIDDPQQMAELQEILSFARKVKGHMDSDGLLSFIISLKRFSDKGKLAFAAAIGAGVAAAIWASVSGVISK